MPHARPLDPVALPTLRHRIDVVLQYQQRIAAERPEREEPIFVPRHTAVGTRDNCVTVRATPLSAAVLTAVVGDHELVGAIRELCQRAE